MDIKLTPALTSVKMYLGKLKLPFSSCLGIGFRAQKGSLWFMYVSSVVKDPQKAHGNTQNIYMG